VRVVSLVPSATETLVAWDRPPIACTEFCEQPGIATVGGTKNPHLDDIVALAPDLVVMCHEENRAPDAEALAAAGLAVHVCSPATVDEVAPALADLASTIGMAPRPERRGGPVDRPEPLRLRAFVPIWRRPWMTITDGTYGSSMLDAIGITNIAADWGSPDAGAAGRYPEVDLAAVAAAEPDVVLVPSEPYAFKPVHLDVLAEIAPVVEVDGQDLFWWGVRTPAAVARLHRTVRSRLAP
jgi:ABC-type Fe3+-hydroxamate transport system substrate-binding protein